MLLLYFVMALACFVILAFSGRLWAHYTASCSVAPSVYAAWATELLAVCGVLTLPALMMDQTENLDDSFGLLLAWVLGAAGLVWLSYRPRSTVWQPLMIAAGLSVLGALIGFGIQCAVQGTWTTVAIFVVVTVLAVVGAMSLLVRIRR